MDYQNGSASKTRMIQQVAHAETSERGTAGKRTFFRFIKQMKICLPICFCVSICSFQVLALRLLEKLMLKPFV
jgi:hypothetical protein